MPNTAALRAAHQLAVHSAHAGVEPKDDALPELLSVDSLLARSLEEGPLPGHDLMATRALLSVAKWSKEFLTEPHPELGRSGHVCPYVSATMREQRYLLTVLNGAATHERETDRVILRLGRHFSELEPRVGRAAQKKTIVILFPDLPEERAGELINAMHQRLKPHFLRAGMMLGEFYRDSDKPGLHNPAFRPLRSDVPLLVIRTMLPQDICFLADEARFVRSYLRTFEARGCAEIQSFVERQGASMSDTQRAMLLELAAVFESGVRQSGEFPRSNHMLPAEATVRARANVPFAVSAARAKP
jgi:uncharacterized protein DUF6875